MARALLCLAALALAGCTTASPAASPTSTAGTTAAAVVTPSVAPGGCGSTPIRYGAMPDWTASAGAPGGPYVMSHEGNLVGVLFGYPLRSGEPTNPTNKILWIAREPRGGQNLKLALRPQDSTSQPVTQEEQANSSPGEIYPSIVNVPAAGCYAVEATWNGNSASLELSYR